MEVLQLAAKALVFKLVDANIINIDTARMFATMPIETLKALAA